MATSQGSAGEALGFALFWRKSDQALSLLPAEPVVKGAGRPGALGEGLPLCKIDARPFPQQGSGQWVPVGPPPAGSGLTLDSWVPGLCLSGLGLGKGAALASPIPTPSSFALDTSWHPTLAPGPLGGSRHQSQGGQSQLPSRG